MESFIIGRLSGNKVAVAKVREQQGVAHDDPALERLKQLDRDVRAHESAHAAASGVQTIGSPRFRYTEGPDGKMYAVGGEVTVAVQSSGRPDDAMRAAQALRASALSSDNPSAADLGAAAEAGRMEMEALAAMARENRNAGKDMYGNGPDKAGVYAAAQKNPHVEPGALFFDTHA